MFNLVYKLVCKKDLYLFFKGAALFFIKRIVWLNANVLKPAIFINGKKLVFATPICFYKIFTNQTNNLP